MVNINIPYAIAFWSNSPSMISPDSEEDIGMN